MGIHPSPDPTAALATTALHALIAVALTLYSRYQRNHPGFQAWAGAFACVTLGFLSLSLRSVGHEAGEFLVTGFLLTGLVLDLEGTLRFLRGRGLAPAWYLLPWGATALQGLFAPQVFTARLWLFSLPAAAVLGTTGAVLLRESPWGAPGLHRALATARFLTAALLLGHSAAWAFLPPVDLAQAKVLGIGALLAYCATSLFQMAGYLWLSGRRAECELQESQRSLVETLATLTASQAELEVLSGLLHLCPKCHRIQDGQGHWHRVEAYVQAHSEAKFSHGVCPGCMQLLYPEFVGEE